MKYVSRIIAFSLALTVSTSFSDDGIFDTGGTTPAGDIIEARGEYAEGLGRESYLRSLSAVQLQKAIGVMLKNRKESIENYYDVKAMRQAAQKKKTEAGIAAYKRTLERTNHHRLSKSQINPQTGELYWPRPLDDDALQPFRKPIEESLAKRASPGETYDRFDYLRVAKMLDLITRAVESIEDKLDTRELVALKQYLEQIDFDARFNAADERIDY